MDFLDLAKERYSCRSFSNEKIKREDLEKILEAGRIAPTAKNNQPQRTLVLESEEELAKFDECSPCRYGAPTVLLVFYDINESWKRRADGEECGQVDASIIITHYMFEAQSLGLGSVWVGMIDPTKIKEKFNVPDNYYVVSALPIGYPAEDAVVNPMHNTKKDLSETVFYGNF